MQNNKAHTATLNRIAQRYGIQPLSDTTFDLEAPEFVVEVETSASIEEAVEKLKSVDRVAYIAVTNKEGIDFAGKLIAGTGIGIMDPQGNVVRPAGNNPPPIPVAE